MAIVAGNFTASDLAVALRASDKMWGNDMLKGDFEGNVDVAKALIAEQNAKVDILEDSEKDRDVKVHWINSCATPVVDEDDDDCDLAGPELGSDSKTYSLGVGKKYSFTVDEMMFRTNNHSMSEAVAVGFLKADKALSEAVCGTSVARIESFKGVNTIADGVGTPNGVTTETDIAAADWDAELFAYLYRIAIQNYLTNPFLLSGTNLFEKNLVTRLSQANANGKGDAALYSLMRTYFDLFNIDPVNSPDVKTYMINRGSIAFASKNYYGAVPIQYKSQDRYSIASRNLPGVRYDVHYTNRCSTNTMKHDFTVKVKYDWFLNPTGCTDTRTGVLAFNKTA